VFDRELSGLTQLGYPKASGPPSDFLERRSMSPDSYPKVPHPIPYQGSKRNLAGVILSYFPARIERLVEPFAGSAAISLSAASNGLAGSFVLNDAHRPIIDLWREIIDRPDELARQYAELWHAQLGRERAYYDTVRRKFNATHQPHYFLYLLARCVKAAVRYNQNGEFNNSPDNRRKGAQPDTMRRRICGASALLRQRTAVSAGDYRQVLEQCTAADLIYMDPPYQGVCRNQDSRYCPRFEHTEFCKSLADLNKRDCRFLVSYDGRMGEKVYGEPLPASLELLRMEICAGRSTQATLLGRDHQTYESLYVSPALAQELVGGSFENARW
jgi:DNA adenine methylase